MLRGDARLVTLTGAGGVGKTRLAHEVAADVLEDYRDGAWLVEFGPLSDGRRLAHAVAEVVGVGEERGRALDETLVAALRPRRLLLILDNCEHVLQASAEMASAIVKAALHVRVLATSREALHVPGEHCYPVLPLPVPRRDDGFEALAQSTAVRLFVERARQHKPAFAFTEREVPVMAELVARLEGIPLALELAAARIRALSVTDINARLP
jgi:predicted ATPase